jgi:hypothetical protein
MTEDDIKYWSIIALEYYISESNISDEEKENALEALECLYE